MSKEEIKQFTSIKLKNTEIESKSSKMYLKEELIIDYDSVINSGRLIEVMSILVHFKTTNRNIRWYCCLMIHKIIKLLQEEKNFKNEDIMEIFKQRNLDEKKVIKILEEVKSKQKQFDEEESEDEEEE